MRVVWEANVELLRRAWCAYDRFDMNLFAACLTDDWRQYDAEGNVVSTLEDERRTMELHRSVFLDRHTEIHGILADANLVACHCTITATRTGAFFDVEATGTQVVTRVMMFNRVRDGRLAETWVMSEEARPSKQITGRPSLDVVDDSE